MPLSPGDKFGPYELLATNSSRRFGAGGMGEVYRTRNPRMGRELASTAKWKP